MYVYCIYTAMPKRSRQLPNCLQRADTSIVLIVVSGVMFSVRAYRVTVSFRCSAWFMYQKHYILVCDRVNNKHFKIWTSQCHMIVQIEPVHEIKIYTLNHTIEEYKYDLQIQYLYNVTMVWSILLFVYIRIADWDPVNRERIGIPLICLTPPHTGICAWSWISNAICLYL